MLSIISCVSCRPQPVCIQAGFSLLVSVCTLGLKAPHQEWSGGKNCPFQSKSGVHPNPVARGLTQTARSLLHIYIITSKIKRDSKNKCKICRSSFRHPVLCNDASRSLLVLHLLLQSQECRLQGFNIIYIAYGLFGSFGNEPMQSCSVRRVSLSLSSALASLASLSAYVYSPPSDRFDHRSFISYKYMQLRP